MPHKKFYNKLGIEIEGGWENTSRILPYFKDDFSIRIPGYTQHGLDAMHGAGVSEPADFPVSGELSPEPFDRIIDLYNWVRKVQPTGVNETASIHVHTSFNTLLDYAMIMTPYFYELILQRMEKFGKEHVNGKDAQEKAFWLRFEGKIKWSGRGFGFCNASSKYRFMNYNAFMGDNWGRRKFKTFEFRGYPSFEKSITTLRGLTVYFQAIRETLTKNKPPQDQTDAALNFLKLLPTGIPEK